MTPKQKRKELEDSKILTRDMDIYTLFDDYRTDEDGNAETLLKKCFLDSCSLRKELENNFNSFDITSIARAFAFTFTEGEEFSEYFIEGIGFIPYDNLYNLMNKKNRTFEDNYCLILFFTAEDFFLNREEHIFPKRIFEYSFSFLEDEDIEEELSEHIIEEYPSLFNSFYKAYNKAYQLKDIGYFLCKMKALSIYDEVLINLLEKYENEYLLVHTNLYNIPNQNIDNIPFIQIDLDKTDKEILDIVHQTKKRLYRDRSPQKKLNYEKILNKVIRKKEFTKGMKYANMLFVYDCLKLGLSEIYITEQIDTYFYSNEINFTLKVDNYKDYKKEIHILINL